MQLAAPTDPSTVNCVKHCLLCPSTCDLSDYLLSIVQWVKKVAKMSKEGGSQPVQGIYGMESICCGIMRTCYLSMWLMALALMKDRALILEDGEHD